MEIKKGMRFKCIRDVFAYSSKEPVYVNGKTYTSDQEAVERWAKKHGKKSWRLA